MTPAARIAAAITVLDEVFSGTASEKALTNWGRQNRYAGSKDRAAVRDHVFDALRCKYSYSALGQGTDGRAVMIGACRAQNANLDDLFSGAKFAPAPLRDVETVAGDLASQPLHIQNDMPDWIWAKLEAQYGEEATFIAQTLRQRAPITLRVNLRKSDRAAAQQLLRSDGIETVENPVSETALTVTENPRKVMQSKAFQTGVVELQDAGSQAMVDALDIPTGARVLDLCAGGGGKSLAIAARVDCQVFAHDISVRRMADIPARAARAGVTISVVEPSALSNSGPFDVILIDAPCSGSGTWRRTPSAKWALTPERLAELSGLQLKIVHSAIALCADQGAIAYGTCSVFDQENQDILSETLAESDHFSKAFEKSIAVSAHADGFFISQFKNRNSTFG